MTKRNEIDAAAVKARRDAQELEDQDARAQAKVEASLLGTLRGELETQAKREGIEITDDHAIAVVRKFIKNADDTLVMLENARLKAEKEKAILERFLPHQMDEAEIEAFVRSKIAANVTGIGPLMSALKAERAGTYDGKLASSVIKRISAE